MPKLHEAFAAVANAVVNADHADAAALAHVFLAVDGCQNWNCAIVGHWHVVVLILVVYW